MAKKDTSKKKGSGPEKKGSGPEKKGSGPEKKQPSRGDAVRAAAAQAIEATAGHAGFTRERAQQLADELVSAAGRFRETLEELRPVAADELVTLRERVAALEARVATLESAAAKRPAPRRRTTAAKAAKAAEAAKPPAEPAEPAEAAKPPAEPPSAD